MQFFAWNGDILAKIVKKPNAEWVLRLYQRVEGPKEEHLKVRTAKRLRIGLKELSYFPEGHLNIHARGSSQIYTTYSHHLRHLLLPEFPELEIAKQSSLGFGLLSQVTSKFHNP